MKLLSAGLLAALAGTARACEGACIVGVTDVWLSNYTAVVQGVFDQTVRILLCYIPEAGADTLLV